jgi:hypothetical protein
MGRAENRFSPVTLLSSSILTLDSGRWEREKKKKVEMNGSDRY